MKIYSVKWCLTQGIMEHDSLIEEDGSVRLRHTKLIKGQYATDMETAKSLAKMYKERRIAALKRELEKLNALTF